MVCFLLPGSNDFPTAACPMFPEDPAAAGWLPGSHGQLLSLPCLWAACWLFLFPRSGMGQGISSIQVPLRAEGEEASVKHFWASCRELLLGSPNSLHPTAAGFHGAGKDCASPQHAGAGSAQHKGWPVGLGNSPGAEIPLPPCVAEGFSQADLTNCQKWVL